MRNLTPEYSVIKPIVSSDSPIGISNGTRIISAVAATMKIKNPTICPPTTKGTPHSICFSTIPTSDIVSA